jgi:hypothetical protein
MIALGVVAFLALLVITRLIQGHWDMAVRNAGNAKIYDRYGVSE